ncbi:hypothetical protein [Nocardioides sp.]|uniref:hypothetical protein n=1 Tax=Nocardioides sp. TaxID=35761 RepID=UPI002ED03EFC
MAQLGGEGVKRGGRVVPASVEASVDGVLDAPPCRPEQRRRRQRGGGDRHVGTGADRARGELEEQDRDEVHGTEDDREPSVDEGPVQDPIDLVQPVLQDRDGDRRGDSEEYHSALRLLRDENHGRRRALADQLAGRGDHLEADAETGYESEPENLAAYVVASPSIPRDQGSERQEEQREVDHGQRLE